MQTVLMFYITFGCTRSKHCLKVSQSTKLAHSILSLQTVHWCSQTGKVCRNSMQVDITWLESVAFGPLAGTVSVLVDNALLLPGAIHGETTSWTQHSRLVFIIADDLSFLNRRIQCFCHGMHTPFLSVHDSLIDSTQAGFRQLASHKPHL